MSRTIARVVLIVAAWIGTAATSQATVIFNVNATGQLVGAQNVDVGGTLYDVAFVDGTCIDLFTGCDDLSDFDFNTEADAFAAGQALLDQVFVDNITGQWDSEPETIFGCLDPSECQTVLPFGFADFSSAFFRHIATLNFDNLGGTLDGPENDNVALDTSLFPSGNFSRFSPASTAVPGPATLALVFCPLLLLMVTRTGRKA